MKKRIYIIVLLLGLIGGGWFILSVPNQTEKEKCVDFVFLGNDSMNFHLDSIYADGADPFNVYSKHEGFIQNETIAVEYAKLLLFPLYGKNVIESEKPYKVKLLNGNIWNVSGSLQKGTEGGVFSILLNRNDGRVMYISHGK